MPQIKMRTTACGPEGNLYEGRVYTLEKAQAKALVDGGFAEAIEAAPRPTQSEQEETEEETAAVEPPETAARRTSRRR